MVEEFYAVLRWQSNQPACWYCVPYVEDTADKGLWEMFGVEKDPYYTVLQAVGIAHKHGKKYRISRDKVMELGSNANLKEGSFYASKFKKGTTMFIRLGCYQDELRFNPDDLDHAFASFQKAPDNLLSALNSKFLEEDDATGVESAESSKAAAPKEASTAHDLQMQLLELINPLLSGDAQKLTGNNRFWKRGLTDDALVAALSPLITSLHSEKMKKMSDRLSLVVSPQSKDVLVTDSDAAASYSVLNSYGIPLQKAAVASLMVDLVKLQKHVLQQNKIDIFKIRNPARPSKSMQLIVVKEAHCHRSFYQTNHKEDWLGKIVNVISTPPAVSEEDAAYWIMIHLGKKYPLAIERACEKLKLMLVKEVMDPVTSQAMWNFVNIGVKKQRKLLRFFNYFFGWRFTCSEMKQKALVPNAIPQKVGDFIDSNEQKRFYYTKQIDEVLTTQLTRAGNLSLENVPGTEDETWVRRLDISQIKKCEVLLGGDHGQGSSKFTVKFILRFHDDNMLPFTIIERVAQIDCKKDSYDMLKTTVVEELDLATKRLAKAGALQVFSTPSGEVYVNLDGKKKEEDDLINTVPLWLGMTGDLLFYSMVLGKENMAGDWCWRCMLSKLEWQDLLANGEAWTHDKLVAHLENLKQITKPMPVVVRGVTQNALLSAIPVKNIVFPLLHGLQLNINFIVKNFHRFLDHMVEDIPMEILQQAD